MRNVNFADYVQMAKRVEIHPQDLLEDDELLTGDALAPGVKELYERGYRRGELTGWHSLDEFFTVRAGELTIITGIPGHGKSSWLDNLMVNLAVRSDWTWAVFSAENFPVARHAAGLMEIYTGKPFAKGPTPRMSIAERDDAMRWVGEQFRFIQPREHRYSLDRIVQAALSMGSVNALVVDPFNELDHDRPKDRREDEWISIQLTKIRWVARNSNLHVFIVAHPAKYERQPGGQKPVITLNDVKGASEWYAKADNGISVWRDETDTSGATDVHIQKIRFREVGRAGGAVRLYYDRITGRFNEPNRPSPIDGHRKQVETQMEASWT